MSILVLTGNETGLSRLAERFEHKSDLYEIRLDFLNLNDKNLWKLISKHKNKIIATLRSKNEWGNFKGNFSEKLKISERLFNTGVRYIDLEFEFVKSLYDKGYKSILLSDPSRIILSFHGEFSERKLEDLQSELSLFKDFQIKTVFKTSSLNDLINLGRFSLNFKNIIVIAAGFNGIYSRCRPSDFNTGFIYAASDKKSVTAPGQLTLDEIAKYRILNHADTEPVILFGGNQIKDSPGADIYNEAFKKHDLSYQYIPVVAETSEEAIDFMTFFRIKKASVTMPLKKNLAGYCELIYAAKKTEVINTLKIEKGKLRGYNTDAEAFFELASNNQCFSETLVLGGGNTALSAVSALNECGYKPVVAMRNPQKKITGNAEVISWKDRFSVSYKTLINTTPLGYNATESPWNDKFPAEAELVVDLVLSNHKTDLIKHAEKQRLAVIDGFDFWKKQGNFQSGILYGKNFFND